MKIGFFDSGLGGLTILKAVAAIMPEYDYEFYGDTAHLPYGDKTEAEIFTLTKAGVEHLLKRDCALVVVACNTASAETLRKLQETILTDEFSERRILGVIIPTVEVVIASGLLKVALVGTKRTIDSLKYDSEFTSRASNLELTTLATPELVPLIETNQLAEASKILTEVIQRLATNGVQGLILGCTHYTVLKSSLRALPIGNFEIFSQDEIIPEKLKDYLSRHPEIGERLTRGSKRNIFLTDATNRYDQAIASLLGGIPLLD